MQSSEIHSFSRIIHPAVDGLPLLLLLSGIQSITRLWKFILLLTRPYYRNLFLPKLLLNPSELTSFLKSLFFLFSPLSNSLIQKSIFVVCNLCLVFYSLPTSPSHKTKYFLLLIYTLIILFMKRFEDISHRIQIREWLTFLTLIPSVTTSSQFCDTPLRINQINPHVWYPP